MKKTLKLTIAAAAVFCLAACGSSSSSADESEEKSETAEKTEETKKDEAAWETGECSVVTWTNSIGTKWIQIVCPVTNTGTRNLYLSAGTMDLEDEEGHLFDTKNLVSVYPDVLAPGETAYYYEETTLDEDAPETLNVLPHVKVKEATVDCIRLDASDISVSEEKYGGVKVTGRLENNTGEAQDLVYVVAFLYDADDQLLAVADTIVTDEIADGDKIGFSMSTFSAPDNVTASAVDHYEIYAYPTQYQF